MHEKLIRIQTQLKAPKNLTNTYAPSRFKYRSAEGIYEAVKPLLNEEQLTLLLNDEVVEVGGRIYIKATAIISDGEKEIRVSAFAREALNKNGMDEAQVTGASSSYARKYALNGLFLLDDTKDADTNEYAEQNGASKRDTTKGDVIPKNTNQGNTTKSKVAGKPSATRLATKDQVELIKEELERTKVEEKTVLEMFKINDLSKMTELQFFVMEKKFTTTPTKL